MRAVVQPTTLLHLYLLDPCGVPEGDIEVKYRCVESLVGAFDESENPYRHSRHFENEALPYCRGKVEFSFDTLRVEDAKHFDGLVSHKPGSVR